jgi:penicillin-binding protein-related factor A (putative recombinase)
MPNYLTFEQVYFMPASEFLTLSNNPQERQGKIQKQPQENTSIQTSFTLHLNCLYVNVIYDTV